MRLAARARGPQPRAAALACGPPLPFRCPVALGDTGSCHARRRLAIAGASTVPQNEKDRLAAVFRIPVLAVTTAPRVGYYQKLGMTRKFSPALTTLICRLFWMPAEKGAPAIEPLMVAVRLPKFM